MVKTGLGRVARKDRRDMKSIPSIPEITPARRRARPLLLAGIGMMLALGTAMPALAQYKQEVRNDMRRCTAGEGPAVAVTVDGVKSSAGNVRVQSYRATPDDWLQKGRWLSRIEVPARAGTMTFCVPVPAAGDYALAVRHDVNGNGGTDFMTDGGAMSNNPSINVFNLGKPSVSKTAFRVGKGVTAIRVRMRYL